MTTALVFIAGLAVGYVCGGYDGWRNGRRWERIERKRESK